MPSTPENARKCSEKWPIVKPAAYKIKTRKEETAVIKTPVIQLTRRQLYDEIWEISVTGVAKKYGVPYGTLMKQVKEANIPIPPSGYWTKLSFGKPVTKTELSEPFDVVVSIFDALPTSRRKNHKEVTALKSDASVPAEKKDEKETETVIHQHICPAEGAVLVDVDSLDKPISKPEAEPTPTVQHADEPETIEQYGQIYNVYDRETLYKEVWKTPVTEVAKRYKVSDVAIHKVCKALDIPTPPLGYWAKLRTGKPVTVTPLPKGDKHHQKTGLRTGTTYQPETEKQALAFLGEENRSVIMAVASQILLTDENARMHAKIIAHRKAAAEWKKQQKKTESRSWSRRDSESPPVLSEGISDESLPRVYRIIDTLIKAMEPLGCSLTDDLGFVINGETVRLAFSESQDKIAHTPTKEENMQLLKYEEERKRYSWASQPQIRKYDYVYNGRIRLTVNSQKSFRDCKSYVVEGRLGDIMIEIYEAAEALKKAREAREEMERMRQEEERIKEEQRKRYNLEVERTLALTNLAEDYDTACKIRRYIAAVEATASQDSETAEWIEWAKAKADWYDPTAAKEDEFFGKRKHEHDAEKKKPQHKDYWW